MYKITKPLIGMVLVSISLYKVLISDTLIKYQGINECNEVVARDYIYLNYYLTSENQIKAKSTPDFKLYSTDSDSLTEVSPEGLMHLWEKRGAKAVLENNICRKINNILEPLTNQEPILAKDFRQVIFELDNKYIVIYSPIDVNNLPKIERPVFVLNKNFEVITKANL